MRLEQHLQLAVLAAVALLYAALAFMLERYLARHAQSA
jgi:hypothetical protein